MSKSNPMHKKKKIALTVVAIIAAISVCAAVIAAFSKTLVTEGTMEPEVTGSAAKTEIPKNSDEIIKYLNSMLDSANDGNRVCVDRSVSLAIDDGSISSPDMSESGLAVVKYAKNVMLGKIAEFYPSYDGDFGGELAALPHISLSSSEASQVSCVRGARDEQGEQILDDSENPVDIDYYFFSIVLPQEGGNIDSAVSVSETFGLNETASVPVKIKAELSPMLDVLAFEPKYNGFSIDAKAECTRDEVDYITLTRNYIVTATVQFKGEYEALGKHTVTFGYTVSETYDYTWAGISFINDEVEIIRGEQDILAVNAVVSEKATEQDYEISFSSSNEGVAAVDGQGNIKGVSVSPEPVTVTVTFKYLGNTYTDSCLVYVTVPVEKIVVSPHTATLMKGETLTLIPAIEPADATRKGVRWFTEDESVAVIDENGVVTAVGAGTTKVYAVTVDGYFRSSCTVTVAD